MKVRVERKHLARLSCGHLVRTEGVVWPGAATDCPVCPERYEVVTVFRSCADACYAGRRRGGGP